MELTMLALTLCLASATARVVDITEVGGTARLNLVRPVESILHNNIKVIKVEENSNTGEIVYNPWEPTQQEIDDAENAYADPDNLAVVREQENNRLTGIINGKKFEQQTSHDFLQSTDQDFVANPINLTYSSSRSRTAATSYIVETLVFCDKEFGDKFQQNRVKILDYLTVYFWDINMRFKTLPSADISFRVTGVVVISSLSGQPFIEQARAPDGSATKERILELFSPWVYNNQGSFPKFDISVLITNTNMPGGGGRSKIGGACQNSGTTVFQDSGEWASNTIGTHEIGHALGAPHDGDVANCHSDGYLMGGSFDHLRWFFSECSDRTIGAYVTSDQASCLRRIDESSWNPISSDFSFMKPPSMDQQCKNRLGPTALVQEPDTANCKRLRCLVPKQGGYWVNMLEFPDNSPCLGGGRCFRGNCRKPDYRVVNVGSGQCLKAPNPFASGVQIQVVPCPQPGTPLDRFAVTDTSFGKTLGTPWQSMDALENGDRCIYTGSADGGGLWTDKCGDNPWHGWNFVDVGNGEFLLKHRQTSRCAKQVGSGIQTLPNCDANDRNMRWKLD